MNEYYVQFVDVSVCNCRG